MRKGSSPCKVLYTFFNIFSAVVLYVKVNRSVFFYKTYFKLKIHKTITSN